MKLIPSKLIVELNAYRGGNVLNSSIGGAFASVEYYDSIEDKIASVIRALAKNHYFTDGNKRTALTVFDELCRLNNVMYTSKFLGPIILKIAKQNLSVEDVRKLLFDK